MAAFFYWTESIITFSFLLVTLGLSFPMRKGSSSVGVPILFWVLLFSATYKPIELYVANYYLYLLFMTGLPILFTLICQSGNLFARIGFSFTYFYAIVALKSLLLSCTQNYSLWDGSAPALSLLIYFLFYGALLLFSTFYYHFAVRVPNRLPSRYWAILAAVDFALALITQLLNFTFLHNTISQHFTISIFAVICGLNLLLYYLSYLVTQTYQNVLQAQSIQQMLQQQVEHLQRNADMVALVRQEKHELKNRYFYISALVREKKYDELAQYVDTELDYRISSMEEFHTGNNMLDLLLTQKVSEARQQGIHVVTCISLPASIEFSGEDLCGLLMNLLDNAIDASKKETAGDILISLHVIKAYLQIEVRNRVSQGILPGNPNLDTTKANAAQHGIGLKVVRSIVKKHNGMLDFQEKDGYFCVTALLEFFQP